MSEIWSLNTLCRCCHADGTHKSLSFTYNFMDKTEVYADMLRDTFGLCINKPLIDASYSICESCIYILRNASRFKKQVEECEKKFENYCRNELSQHIEIKLESIDDEDMVIKPEINLKAEDCHSDDDGRNIYTDTYTEYSTEPNNDQNIEIANAIVKKNIKLEKKKIVHSDKISSKQKKIATLRKLKREGSVANICKMCDGSFKTLKDLREHIANQHSNMFPCNICSKTFNRKRLLLKHVQIHNRPLSHECPICGRKFIRLHNMIEHRNKCTNNKSFTCDKCNKTFSYKSTIRKHLAWHNGTNKRFMCDICGNSFNDKSNLNIHCRNVHEKLRLFKCDLCPKTFAAKKTLKIHYRTHTGERPYKCEDCGNTYPCSTALRSHRKLHENMTKYGGRYLCKICGTVFNDRGSFARHSRSHIGVKPHKCVICEKDFAGHFSLKRHMEKHEGIKRFTCDMCGKKFSGKSQLKRHISSLHDPNIVMKVKVKCHMCKMNVRDLEKHMKSHLNRSLQCGYCPKSYSEKSALNRHVKVIHFGTMHSCETCGKKYTKLLGLRRHYKKQHSQVKEDVNKDNSSLVNMYKGLCAN